MITYHDVEQGSPEWLEARKGKFTGSIAYKLLSSFGAGDHAKNVESDFKGTFATKRGSLLENEAIELYETITKEEVKHCGFVTNDAYSDCLFSPDGLTKTHLIEVKCFSEANHLEIWRAGSWLEIPRKILAQIQFGLMITELPAARLVIYNPKLMPVSRKFKIIEIPRSEATINNFRRILGGVKTI